MALVAALCYTSKSQAGTDTDDAEETDTLGGPPPGNSDCRGFWV